jgi:hypothetical protein
MQCVHPSHLSLFFCVLQVWSSTDLGSTWSESATAPWVGRGDAGIVVSDAGNLFVIGGYGETGYLNDVWMLDTDFKTWKQMNAAAAWTPRWGAVVETFNNTLVLIGGDEGEGAFGNFYNKNNEVSRRPHVICTAGSAL